MRTARLRRKPEHLIRSLLEALSSKSTLESLEALSHSRKREHPGVFDVRFDRCRTSLRYIASLIVDEADDIDAAVRNCWRRASRLRPVFRTEGEFRCWLLRVLIEEAVALRRHSFCGVPLPIEIPARSLRWSI